MKLNKKYFLSIAGISIVLLWVWVIKLAVYILTDEVEVIAIAEVESRYPSPPLAAESGALFQEILRLIPDDEETSIFSTGESTITIDHNDIDPEDDPEVAIRNAFATKYGFTYEPDPEKPLYLFQEEGSFDELLALAQEQQALIESFWSPINEYESLLDTLDRFDTVDDFHEFSLTDQSNLPNAAMKLMRFHTYKAYLLVSNEQAAESIQLLSRLLSIFRKTHPNTRSLYSEMVIASSELQLLKHISQIATNTDVDRDTLYQAYEASLPKLDPIDNLERILLHEATVTHQLINQAIDTSDNFIVSKLILPNHTSNLLTRHYQKIIALYRAGDFEGVADEEDRFIKRVQKFGIRNYVGKIILSASILTTKEIAPDILKSESILDEHRQELRRQLN